MAYQTYRGGGGGGRNGGGNPEDLLRDLQKQFDEFFKGFKGKSSSIWLAIIVVFGVWGAFTSYYTVEPNEEAVVLRLGRYHLTNPPGFHFKVPFNIDKVVKVKTQLVMREEFGYRTTGSQGGRSVYDKNSLKRESSMLTGDLNVADVEWIVQYKISDPKKYLFHSAHPRRNLRDISESIMRRVVGDRTVSEVLTTGRAHIRDESKTLMQELLNKYDIGIRVVTVELQDVNPPDVVKPAFNDVNAAKQEQEKLINMAEERYNKVIPEAKGKADETISQAMGYSTALVNRAQGDAKRFNSMLKEYRRAPNITRKRIYLETMEELFDKFEKLVIVDSKVKGILPVFSAPKELKP